MDNNNKNINQAEYRISKNYLVVFLPYFLFVQGIFVFYKIIPILLTYYQPNPMFFLPWGLVAINGILVILTGVGILTKKRWSIILYGVIAIFPLLITFFLSQLAGIATRVKLPGIDENWIVISNIIFVIYLLLSEWKKWTKV